MDVRALLIAGMMLSMLITFIIIFARLKSFRVAFLATMIVGTKWSLVISLFGYDKPLTTVYFVNRANPYIVKSITITVCQVIGAAYILFMVVAIAWPWITDLMPRELRKDVERVWEVRGESSA